MSNIIDPKLYKRVVSYGCSFTAGDEIVDHLLLNMTFEECNALKQEFKNQEQFYKHYNFNNYSGHEFMEKHSWSGQLAKLCNLPYINRAMPGSSMGHIYFKIYRDYLNNQIDKNDLILVGITSPDRIMFWDKNLTELDASPLPTYLNKIDPFGRRAVSELYDDNILILTYFSFLQNVYNLNKFLNIRMQNMLSDNIPGHVQFRYQVRPDVDNIIKHLYDSMDNICLKDESLQNKFFTVLGRCGFLHPPLESHTYLAEQIYNTCVIK